MSEANPVAEAQVKQGDPVLVEGAGTKPADPAAAPKGEESNFNKIRRELKAMQKAAVEREDRIRLQEERINTLLDVVERRSASKYEPEGLDLSHLAKDDPDRPLIERKLAPLLKKRGDDGELASIKEELKKLREDRDRDSAGKKQMAEFQQITDEIAEDRGLSSDVANAVRRAILEKRVGGETYEDAFDNAVVWLKGAGKYPAEGKKPEAGKGGSERVSVGGVMPQQAGAPVSSDDYRTLRKQFREAKEEGNGDEEAKAFQALLLKAKEEQARG